MIFSSFLTRYCLLSVSTMITGFSPFWCSLEACPTILCKTLVTSSSTSPSDSTTFPSSFIATIPRILDSLPLSCLSRPLIFPITDSPFWAFLSVSLLRIFAINAKLSFSFPRLTSLAVTKALQSIFSASFSIASALLLRSLIDIASLVTPASLGARWYRIVR